MDVRSSARRLGTKSNKLHQGKANLGIDYEGLEIGGENLVSQSPNKNQYMKAQNKEAKNQSANLQNNIHE